MTGDLSELVQLLVHAACDHVPLAQLSCGLRMHGLAQVLKELGAVTHLGDELVQRLHALSCAKLHDRSGLTQTSAQLHDLTRGNLARSGTRNDALKVADVAYHGLQTHQVVAVIYEMLDYSISAFKLMKVHHRHSQPCPEHTCSHR